MNDIGNNISGYDSCSDYFCGNSRDFHTVNGRAGPRTRNKGGLFSASLYPFSTPLSPTPC